ncbi:MAG: hypothetical protein OXG65_04670 [Chloroflexi bacterium]|nr:hypothetical protein [Chloroflexota bacterium]
MIEREPFIIRNGLRIFSVVVVLGLVALIVVGIRFQIENAEHANEIKRFETRVPNARELKAGCDFFGGQYLGMPVVAPGGASAGLMEACNLAGTAQAGWQCEHFDGAYSRGSCSVDVGATLQAMPRVPG